MSLSILFLISVYIMKFGLPFFIIKPIYFIFISLLGKIYLMYIFCPIDVNVLFLCYSQVYFTIKILLLYLILSIKQKVNFIYVLILLSLILFTLRFLLYFWCILYIQLLFLFLFGLLSIIYNIFSIIFNSSFIEAINLSNNSRKGLKLALTLLMFSEVSLITFTLSTFIYDALNSNSDLASYENLKTISLFSNFCFNLFLFTGIIAIIILIQTILIKVKKRYIIIGLIDLSLISIIFFKQKLGILIFNFNTFFFIIFLAIILCFFIFYIYINLPINLKINIKIKPSLFFSLARLAILFISLSNDYSVSSHDNISSFVNPTIEEITSMNLQWVNILLGQDGPFAREGKIPSITPDQLLAGIFFLALISVICEAVDLEIENSELVVHFLRIVGLSVNDLDILQIPSYLLNDSNYLYLLHFLVEYYNRINRDDPYLLIPHMTKSDMLFYFFQTIIDFKDIVISLSEERKLAVWNSIIIYVEQLIAATDERFSDEDPGIELISKDGNRVVIVASFIFGLMTILYKIHTGISIEDELAITIENWLD